MAPVASFEKDDHYEPVISESERAAEGRGGAAH